MELLCAPGVDFLGSEDIVERSLEAGVRCESYHGTSSLPFAISGANDAEKFSWRVEGANI